MLKILKKIKDSVIHLFLFTIVTIPILLIVFGYFYSIFLLFTLDYRGLILFIAVLIIKETYIKIAKELLGESKIGGYYGKKL